MARVLTIAGSDSSGRAGIQADLLTLASLGVHGVTAITAVTAQNAQGVSAITPLSADLVTAQIEAVADDGGIQATKIGMLATAAIAEAVAAAIEELELPLVVLDPVLASTSGTRLLDLDGVQALITELLPRVLVVTPNVPEAEALSGIRIGTLRDVREAARRLHKMGAANVIVKGGHLGALGSKDTVRAEGRGQRANSKGQRAEGEGQWAEGKGQRAEGEGQRAEGTEVVDVLFDGKAFREARVPRVQGSARRGTGCAFSSAVAAFLALGHPLPDAAQRAQVHVATLIASASSPGRDVY